MKFGIVVFPGTWSDRDCMWALRDVMGYEAVYLWHADDDLAGCDCVVLPGGFSYGDYLRCGALARVSPIMRSVASFADAGGMVWGICNGFQILCESGLLPGALLYNDSLEFRCQWVHLRAEAVDHRFGSGISRGELFEVPISHGQGAYFADERTLDDLEASGQIAFRYCDERGLVSDRSNPNGSCRSIAGIVNRAGNVLGMMPHPERCVEPELGGSDGRRLLAAASAMARAAFS